LISGLITDRPTIGRYCVCESFLLHRQPCLQADPRRLHRLRRTEVQHTPPLMSQHDEHGKDSESHHRRHEEVQGRQLLDMVFQKHPPRLRWWLGSLNHVLRNGACDTSMGSLSSSPCNLGAPRSMLQALISPFSFRNSFDVPGHPMPSRRLFHYQSDRPLCTA
jgi:hypothetical protein